MKSVESSPLGPEPPGVPAVDGASLAELEAIERDAWVDLIEGAPSSLRRDLGLAVERRGGATAIRSTAVESLMLNRIFLPPSPSPVTDELELLVDGFARAGIGRYLIHVPPPHDPRQIAAWGEPRGITPFVRDWVKFARGTEGAPNADTDLSIRRAEPRDAEAFAQILVRAFEVSEAAIPLFAIMVELEDWHTYVACEGDVPVAAAALFARGGVASLSGAATQPSHRRRGAQAALLARRIDQARRLGCRLVSTETGVLRTGEPNHSYRNMVRAGLEPVYLRPNFAPRGTTWTRR